MPAADSPCDITEDDPDGDFTPLAVDCADEDWDACDDLWLNSPVGSDWEEYGSTCGGRNDETSGGCATLYAGGGAGAGAATSRPPRSRRPASGATRR